MRKTIASALLVLIAVLAVASLAAAQPSGPMPKSGEVGFDQLLGAEVPLGLEFRDELGQPVKLIELFKEKRPVILALAYYECPMLCTLTLNGLFAALRGVDLAPGNDFEVVAVSFNPAERPELARAKKASYMQAYNRVGAEGHVHFLTGDERSIHALTRAVGFRYVYDPIGKQYAHATGIVVLTPSGVVARYLYGVDYPPNDLRLSLVEAGGGAIGRLTDKLLLLCFHYNPEQGRYGTFAIRAIRAGGAVTALVLGASIVFMSWRSKRARGDLR